MLRKLKIGSPLNNSTNPSRHTLVWILHVPGLPTRIDFVVSHHPKKPNLLQSRDGKPRISRQTAGLLNWIARFLYQQKRQSRTFRHDGGMLMKKSIFLTFLCVSLLFAGQAYALALAPTSIYKIADGDDVSPDWNVWNTGDVEAIIAGDPFYIDTSNPRVVEGFSEGQGTTGDPVDIAWYGERYLLLTDGNNTPWWYLFDLDGAAYDGVITLSGFWDGQGQLSNARFYGTPVPEPSTILLLGLGLMGIAGIGRKRIKS